METQEEHLQNFTGIQETHEKGKFKVGQKDTCNPSLYH
jgi:hypothetical protein